MAHEAVLLVPGHGQPLQPETKPVLLDVGGSEKCCQPRESSPTIGRKERKQFCDRRSIKANYDMHHGQSDNEITKA